jgi:hypothetical protein
MIQSQVNLIFELKYANGHLVATQKQWTNYMFHVKSVSTTLMLFL